MSLKKTIAKLRRKLAKKEHKFTKKEALVSHDAMRKSIEDAKVGELQVWKHASGASLSVWKEIK